MSHVSTPTRVRRALRQLSTYNPDSQIDNNNQQLRRTWHEEHILWEGISWLGAHLLQGIRVSCDKPIVGYKFMT